VLDRVIVSEQITVLEARLANPSDAPAHCPPAITQVHFHPGGRTQSILFAYAYAYATAPHGNAGQAPAPSEMALRVKNDAAGGVPRRRKRGRTSLPLQGSVARANPASAVRHTDTAKLLSDRDGNGVRMLAVAAGILAR